VPTLVSQLLSGLGVGAGEGYIDYSLGAPLDYIPIHKIAGWDDQRLRAAFEGRIVLVGSLLLRVDRWRLPVLLLASAPGLAGLDPQARERRLAYTQPGVLVHLQALRSHLGPGLLRPVPDWAQWLLCAAAALVVLVRNRPAVVVLGAVVVP